MTDIHVCTIPDEVKAALRKFRFRKAKNCAAIIMKIDVKSMEVEIEDEMEDCTIAEVAEELPEFNPRFVAYSYCHDHGDGRISYPLCFIYYCPSGVKPETNMIYAGSKPSVLAATDITKVFEMRDAEDMTEEWLKTKLGFFG
ncbi:uncharacterized protein MONBRDRAFT_9075 [Monosiga brevicollis MX1]|uniref:ADF-H domain-containing protein n=1 Tax=Monosiga brevicollis TaxID=81824 RepID=A9V206_MONBE|nr:uncharacterized protein MONBRDRAFT_9075 [Monosiga brevicollis MX1]EDQ88658.1 predicted protein [Monosiga brevicollis MX1]|eukprot:XP_001746762.1 hypothetical protein [Monosiga brevicollis MX1]